MFRKKRKSLIKTPKRRRSHVTSSPSRFNRRRPRLRRLPKLPKIAKQLILLLLGLSLLYIFFYSPLFQIKHITIADSNAEDQALSAQLKKNLEPQIGENLLFVDTQELDIQLLDHFGEIQNLNIRKKLPDTLEISFSQYELVANLINETSTVKKSYIINAIGYGIKEDLKSNALPTILIQSAEPLNTATALIPQAKLDYILGSTTYYEEKFGMEITQITFKPFAREVHLLTEKDFTIWLDIQRPYEDQFRKLKKALVKLDIYNEPLLYIDLRIAGGSGDKIIYMRK